MTTTLVTGCNRGIGLQLVKQLHERGDDVIGVCRQASEDLRKLGIRVIDGIDVSAGDSVELLKAKLGNERLDILINNAGILRHDSFGALDYDSMLEQYRVNALGPLRVTEALVDNLAEDAKVAIVTSRVGSIEDNGSGGNWGYRASKTAVNMIGTNLMHELKPRGPGSYRHDAATRHSGAGIGARADRPYRRTKPRKLGNFLARGRLYIAMVE
jgi:NAD(P)-dependent dehydrogenase (short-subunit alcohol dehydrogenase family)